ncbi:MAG: hypothetical protein AAFX01_13770 [Cyanobacteria bacterium J06638_28]
MTDQELRDLIAANATAIAALIEQQNRAQLELRESINDVGSMIGGLT